MKTLIHTTRRAALGALAGAALLAAAPATFAQSWPGKPVRILIGAPPGGRSSRPSPARPA